MDVRTLGRFKVRVTEEHVRGARLDLWHLELLCRHGLIYPHGGDRFQAYSDRPRARRLLKALPCVTVHQDGDIETTVVFNVRDFAAVASVMKPKKKRPAPGWIRSTPGESSVTDRDTA